MKLLTLRCLESASSDPLPDEDALAEALDAMQNSLSQLAGVVQERFGRDADMREALDTLQQHFDDVRSDIEDADGDEGTEDLQESESRLRESERTHMVEISCLTNT